MKRGFSVKGLAAFLGFACGALAAAQPAAAGWAIDPGAKPKQAILTYSEEEKGPRILIVACLRDTEEIGVYSTAVAPGGVSKSGIMAMQLVNGSSKYTLRGEPGIDSTTNQPAFRYETNIDSKALQLFRADMMPIMQGRGPIVIRSASRSAVSGRRHRRAAQAFLGHLLRPLGDAMAAKKIRRARSSPTIARRASTTRSARRSRPASRSPAPR